MLDIQSDNIHRHTTFTSNRRSNDTDSKNIISDIILILKLKALKKSLRAMDKNSYLLIMDELFKEIAFPKEPKGSSTIENSCISLLMETVEQLEDFLIDLNYQLKDLSKYLDELYEKIGGSIDFYQKNHGI